MEGVATLWWGTQLSPISRELVELVDRFESKEPTTYAEIQSLGVLFESHQAKDYSTQYALVLATHHYQQFDWQDPERIKVLSTPKVAQIARFKRSAHKLDWPFRESELSWHLMASVI